MRKGTKSNTLGLIPGVGKAVEKDLISLGVTKISDLSGKDPEGLYKQLCIKTGIKVDRCMLYVFRCAVYFATYKNHDPELLKRWNWKD